MELMKKIGLMILGGAVATIIIFGYFFNKRISNLEGVTNQIVQVIQQQQAAQRPNLPNPPAQELNK